MNPFQAREEGPRHHQHEDVLRYVQQAPDDICWTIDQAEFDDLLCIKKNRLLALTEFLPTSTDVLVAWVRSSSLMFIKLSWKEVLFLIVLLNVGRSSSPRLLTSMTLEGLFDLLMRFARWHYAIVIANFLHLPSVRGLHWYTMRCIHLSQRCISSRQMTDNIFEIETTALVHVACAPQEPGPYLQMAPRGCYPKES